jgi:hypothetical protein
VAQVGKAQKCLDHLGGRYIHIITTTTIIIIIRYLYNLYIAYPTVTYGFLFDWGHPVMLIHFRDVPICDGTTSGFRELREAG